MELDKAKKKGFVSTNLIETKGTNERKKLLAVVGILTGFGRRHNRDAIRKAWMPTGRIPFPFVSFILTLSPFLVNVLSLPMSLNHTLRSKIPPPLQKKNCSILICMPRDFTL